MKREKDDTGAQLITTAGGFAYRWSGKPALQKGDKVLLPGNWTTGGDDFTDTVDKLHSKWDGEHRDVVRKL